MSIVKCSQLVAYNYSGVISKWAIFTLDGDRVYISGNYTRLQTWSLHLSKLEVQVGTQLLLKAINVGVDSTADVTLQYEPDAPTLYFLLVGTADANTLTLENQVNSSETPPVLPCSKICAANDTAVVTKWQLLEGNTTIYQSGKYSYGKECVINLSDLYLEVGEKVQLKAAVEGKDSLGYLILEYLPDNNVTAYFELVGTAFYTMLMYQGTTPPKD